MFPDPGQVSATLPRVLIEVIVETVEDAREAEQGGAGRLELVRALDRGGLTPADGLVAAVALAVRIPVRVMLRDSEPFELVDRAELGRLHAVARAAHAAGADGFVAGFLRGGSPDLAAVQGVLGSLDGPLTFHRAFEDARDPLQAMAVLAADPRIDRILTSGGPGTWDARLTRLRELRRPRPRTSRFFPAADWMPRRCARSRQTASPKRTSDARRATRRDACAPVSSPRSFARKHSPEGVCLLYVERALHRRVNRADIGKVAGLLRRVPPRFVRRDLARVEAPGFRRGGVSGRILVDPDDRVAGVHRQLGMVEAGAFDRDDA